MKKIKFFVFFLFFVFLVSCDDISIDEIPPVVIGEDSIEIILNSTPPDWAQYITATDETDGIIQITVEMIDASDVDLSKVGIYEVKYSITDLEGNISEHYLTVEVIDNISPTLSLIGEETINLEYGDTYLEAGALYADNYDLEGTVIIGGDVVNSNVLGSYIITYNAVDSSGNTALEITRTINVVDTTSPNLSLIGEETINLEYGDTYLEAGALYADNYDLEGTVIIGGDVVNSNVLGSYIITYNAVDSSGNTALEITRTVNVVDTTFPNLSLIGDQTINLEYGDTYLEAGALYADNYDLEGTVIIGGDLVNSNVLGSYIITYNAVDSSGNTALEITRTVNVVCFYVNKVDTISENFLL